MIVLSISTVMPPKQKVEPPKEKEERGKGKGKEKADQVQQGEKEKGKGKRGAITEDPPPKPEEKVWV